ncbi:MAG: GAF domain-containing sensor histidine kinase [Chloroflexota bacterium]|nr:GAF domain-containing sensor histidine kinase [Chloroflexota bacterium]
MQAARALRYKESPGERKTRIAGATLMLARGVWLLLVVPSVALFVIGLPAYYQRLQQACVDATTCSLAMSLSAKGIHAFAAIGVSLSDYALFSVIFWTVIVAIWSGMGALIFWRGSDDWLALLAAFALVMFNISFPGLSITALALSYPALTLPIALIGALGVAAMSLFFLLFPDGRLVARWTGLVIPLIVAQTIASVAPPTSALNSAQWPAWLDILLSLTIYGVIIFSQVYRYRRMSTAIERQQAKWVAFAIITVVVGFLLLAVLFNGVFPQASQQDTPASLFSLAYPLLLLLIPVSVGFAILRYRLWDIDLIVRRTLVYGLLTAFVIGVYILIVGYLGALFRTSSNLLISLVATGIVAVLFQPLRGVLQRGVTRLLYGLRDEPYIVLAGLGQRLKATLGPDDVLPAIATTVQEALKLSYAAIEVGDGPALRPAAVAGAAPTREQDSLLRLPLTYQRQTVGALLIAPRGRDDTLTPADLSLLDDLTQQIGAAVHTMRLTSDLQRSRERLVTTREEERRRLRRDLHDGLGPMLSAIMLKVGLVRTLYQRDLTATGALLDQLETEIDSVIGDIRRLVYNLRPPALDELGLAGALREYVARLGSEGQADQPALTVTVEAPESLGRLPAAVEVAVYRITQEAVTNVIRHAHARSCCVRLQVTDALLLLDVYDDGVGMGDSGRVGVGLASMRERAEELDGTFTLSEAQPSGTCVTVRLPLGSAQTEAGARDGDD